MQLAGSAGASKHAEFSNSCLGHVKKERDSFFFKREGNAGTFLTMVDKISRSGHREDAAQVRRDRRVYAAQRDQSALDAVTINRQAMLLEDAESPRGCLLCWIH